MVDVGNWWRTKGSTVVGSCVYITVVCRAGFLVENELISVVSSEFWTDITLGGLKKVDGFLSETREVGLRGAAEPLSANRLGPLRGFLPSVERNEVLANFLVGLKGTISLIVYQNAV